MSKEETVPQSPTVGAGALISKVSAVMLLVVALHSSTVGYKEVGIAVSPFLGYFLAAQLRVMLLAAKGRWPCGRRLWDQ
jgi:uncharacterized membrane protein YkvI